MRQALEMALEALKDNQHLVADNERHAYVMEYNSIIEKCEEALAQPEQEPVAWRYGALLYWDKFDALEFMRTSNDGYQLEPLYTTPPQRKPLTPKQIEKLFPESLSDDGLSPYWLTFARAIEAAHGIKE